MVVTEGKKRRAEVYIGGIDIGGASRRLRNRRDRDALKENTRKKQQHRLAT